MVDIRFQKFKPAPAGYAKLNQVSILTHLHCFSASCNNCMNPYRYGGVVDMGWNFLPTTVIIGESINEQEMHDANTKVLCLLSTFVHLRAFPSKLR